MIATGMTTALVALGLCATLLLEWAVQHFFQRRRLAADRQRHVQLQQLSQRQLGQAKRQIEQLQQDLTASRDEARSLRQELRSVAAGRPVLARAAVDARMWSTLDDASCDVPESARRLPPDGFAETQPLPLAAAHRDRRPDLANGCHPILLSWPEPPTPSSRGSTGR